MSECENMPPKCTSNNCCARRLLSIQPDFLSQKCELEEKLEGSGGNCRPEATQWIPSTEKELQQLMDKRSWNLVLRADLKDQKILLGRWVLRITTGILIDSKRISEISDRRSYVHCILLQLKERLCPARTPRRLRKERLFLRVGRPTRRSKLRIQPGG